MGLPDEDPDKETLKFEYNPRFPGQYFDKESNLHYNRFRDWNEPPHIHIQRDDDIAKFWLKPVRIQGSDGFNRAEIARLAAHVVERQNELLET